MERLIHGFPTLSKQKLADPAAFVTDRSPRVWRVKQVRPAQGRLCEKWRHCCEKGKVRNSQNHFTGTGREMSIGRIHCYPCRSIQCSGKIYYWYILASKNDPMVKGDGSVFWSFLLPTKKYFTQPWDDMFPKYLKHKISLRDLISYDSICDSYYIHTIHLYLDTFG